MVQAPVKKTTAITQPEGMPPKGVVPRPQISTGLISEEIKQKQEQSAYYEVSVSARNLFYRKMEAGERRRVRFLADFEDELRILTHTRYVEGATDNLFDAICHQMYGLSCPHCKAGNKPDTKYAWPVWLFPSDKELKENVQSGRFAIALFKHSKASVVGKLNEYYIDEDYGTILEHDWTLKRTGKTMTDTIYTVTPKPKAKDTNTDDLPLPSKEKMLELATCAFNTSLYKILEEYGIPDGDDTWTKPLQPTENEEEDDEDDTPPAPRAQVGKQKVAKPVQKAKPVRPADAEGDDDDEFTVDQLEKLLASEDDD